MDALAQEEGAVPSAPAAGRSRDPELRLPRPGFFASSSVPAFQHIPASTGTTP